MPKARPLEERFWEKVLVGAPDECWTWTASTVNGRGYGQIGGGKAGGMLLAHRVSYTLHFGEIPAKDADGNRILVRHKCDNRSCVNPEHLELGTTLDNARDMVDRGRATQGGHYRARTHCIRNHEFTPDNTFTVEKRNRLGRTTKARRCRECSRARDRKRRGTGSGE